ncbi:MAG: hypothetical protein M1831_001868 [Alyxoria varia]|nr:MAG: hypothetical protein M1831_001868 [Alyxoria varia]
MRRVTLSLAITAALALTGLMTYLFVLILDDDKPNHRGGLFKAPQREVFKAKVVSERAERSDLSGPALTPPETEKVMEIVRMICSEGFLPPYDTPECERTCELLDDRAPPQAFTSALQECDESGSIAQTEAAKAMKVVSEPAKRSYLSEDATTESDEGPMATVGKAMTAICSGPGGISPEADTPECRRVCQQWNPEKSLKKFGSAEKVRDALTTCGSSLSGKQAEVFETKKLFPEPAPAKRNASGPSEDTPSFSFDNSPPFSQAESHPDPADPSPLVEKRRTMV